MHNSDNILILFDGPHIAYSPTTVQLYKELSKQYHVTIIAQDPNNYTGEKLINFNLLYYRYYNVRSRYFYLALFEIISLFNRKAKYFKRNNLNYKDYFFKFLFIKNQVANRKFKRIISIDTINLFFCSLLDIRTDFISLEVCRNYHLLSLIDKSIINCVIIQSVERYNFLFKDAELKTFFVQNAPVFKSSETDKKNNILIYTGQASDVFGFYYCLDYLNQYKNEKLFVQGAVLPEDRKKIEFEYGNLVKEGRLQINDNYVNNDEMLSFLSPFEIGFCFYNFNHPFIKENSFNYESAPSGKMFKYLASGIPVVCSNILGFHFVNKFQCGILIENPTPGAIHNAILKIREKYDFYVKNASKAAEYFSFDKAIAPYLNFLENSA